MRTTLVPSGQGTMFPKCKAVTNSGAHFFSRQVSHSSREAAFVGQDLRFLCLRPLETHSNGEHRTQAQEIKSHVAPQRHGAGGEPQGEAQSSKFCNPHLWKERAGSAPPPPQISSLKFFHQPHPQTSATPRGRDER